MSVLEVPGAQLYYESVGSGPPLVLIPGGNGTAHIFGPIMQHLAEHYTVTAYDRRGFARSQLVGASNTSVGWKPTQPTPSRSSTRSPAAPAGDCVRAELWRSRGVAGACAGPRLDRPARGL